MNKHILSIDWDCFFMGSEGVSAVCGSCSFYNICDDSEGSDVRPTLHYTRGDPERARVSSNPFSPAEWIEPITDKLSQAQLIVAECHADIYGCIDNFDSVDNMDAHHDCWKTDYAGLCGTWGNKAKEEKKADIVWLPLYNTSSKTPANFWEHPSVPKRNKYHKLFLCQSRPWTPRAKDTQFYDFVVHLQKITNSDIICLGEHVDRLRRGIYRAMDRN